MERSLHDIDMKLVEMSADLRGIKDQFVRLNGQTEKNTVLTLTHDRWIAGHMEGMVARNTEFLELKAMVAAQDKCIDELKKGEHSRSWMWPMICGLAALLGGTASQLAVKMFVK